MDIQKDLLDIKNAIKELAERQINFQTELHQIEKKFDRRFDELQKRIILLEDSNSKIELQTHRIRHELSDVKYSMIEMRGALNGLIGDFYRFHKADLPRFERLEKYAGFYNPDDPLIVLRDADSELE